MSLRFYDVTSADGTRLNAWTNDAEGPTVLLCNGLGTSAHVWPALLDDACNVRVISWNHRGVGGSARPADKTRIGVDAFVEDALAVLDDAGVDSCPVAGWSIGVNTQFELATLHPDRVTGLFAVAGVPGGTFSSMGAPLAIPRFARHTVALSIARILQLSGLALSPITTRLPIGSAAARTLRYSGFMLPGADNDIVRTAFGEFLATDVEWYMRLAVAASAHPRVPLSKITVPTHFVAGRYDIFANSRDMASAADRMPHATYVELPGSHFVQMEKPDLVHQHLLHLLARISLST
jgi:pimeloyl-ACP methyl ester carboxylesterase